MNVHELNQEQKHSLKIDYMLEDCEDGKRDFPSWGELADANEIISDEEIFERYANIDFVEEDFFV